VGGGLGRDPRGAASRPVLPSIGRSACRSRDRLIDPRQRTGLNSAIRRLATLAAALAVAAVAAVPALADPTDDARAAAERFVKWKIDNVLVPLLTAVSGD